MKAHQILHLLRREALPDVLHSCLRTSGFLNFSSVLYSSLSLRWYELARSGDSAIRAITTHLMNLETKRRYLSGTWARVKNLGFQSCIFTHSFDNFLAVESEVAAAR
ncbi:hypothetical protein Acr_11g0008530 [Actinidia rufa]|uniref:Uncharacterized protein n=1 Tax=Actinidia rufa TaxID=165716 RepID=A0A7J0FF90_9ERIC|nr:hypothetical protein Acr_11g0008530 [Actinidia rufa]